MNEEKKKIKIVAISDTHGNDKWHRSIPECDILVHSGDISPMWDHNSDYQMKWFDKHFLKQLEKIKAKNIVFIGGNHDFGLFRHYNTNTLDDFRKKLPPNIHYLMDNGVELDGIKIWGTPWVVRLPSWAFNRNDNSNPNDTSNALDVFSQIPEGYDILVSHGPAYGYSDTIMEYGRIDHLGSEILFQEIKRAKPKWVLTGHIHSANHEVQTISVGDDKINFVCTSLLDEQYKIGYPYFEFEI